MTGPDGVSIPPDSLGISGKTVSDLIGDVEVTRKGNTYSYAGEVKEVTEPWSIFSGDEATGHFLPIMLPTDCVGKEITVKGRTAGDKKVTIDPDRLLIQRLENLSGNTLTIEKDGKDLMTADVTDLLPYGKDAVTVLEDQDFGGCGKTTEWYTGMKAEWDGINCSITGTFTKGTKSDATGKYQIGVKLSPYFGSRTVKVGNADWTKEETNFIGHKSLESGKDTVIEVSCNGYTLARLTFKGATFNE